MVVSCDGFYNEPHTDNDHTRYAFGINCLIDRETGKPYQLEGSENKGLICGSSFILGDFDIVVDHDRCDGIYETLWDTQVEHYTAESITYDEHGHEISPTKCAITRFGTSCQISKSLVERINIVEKERDKMKPTEWEAYHKSRVRTLEEETEFKEIKAVASEAIMVERESMRKEARKVKAEMKRKAKLNTLFKGGKV
ncbi:uncharacterized protein MELLADRAFT_72421 [Melampsora larici-populina 98AG31]|uniref:Tet-like 2OG-Fe(II) oxygenase domain-containing protein n=1 Tax=Melampsora larici-populina (strain 98AG31 / pathotype 3-4-7) TaxID=747676 RepID=F4RTI7_MELLP|nr:uncharacterized protein MELLADRAFT_72421 [Melampsora larici-populina 98AG31]EGG04330.1 hypothetical protein MELLADRAFT_72421 [Melampsora larici-populina 98AG31]